MEGEIALPARELPLDLFISAPCSQKPAVDLYNQPHGSTSELFILFLQVPSSCIKYCSVFDGVPQ
jgi:hypothetical protein